MHLEGSCHCGAVTFSVEAAEPVPFMKCYCSICRKTAGGGGFAINLGADYRTLKIKGREHVRTYRVRLDRTEYGKDEANAARKKSKVDRTFCGRCGSALWFTARSIPNLCIHSPAPSTRRFPRHRKPATSCSTSRPIGSRCRAGVASTTIPAILMNRSRLGTNATASTSHHTMRKPRWPPI